MRIIGLCGYAGAGKDAVAHFIQESGLNVETKRQGFADKLKLSAARCFEPEATQEEALEFCNWLKTEGTVMVSGFNRDYTVSGRKFLQNYGTEAHRDTFDQDFWLDAVLPLKPGNEVETSRDDCDMLLIPDVRFENEAERVTECGGEIWEVVRTGIDRAGAHSSEDGIPEEYISRRIANDGTLVGLKWKVVEALGLVPSPQ